MRTIGSTALSLLNVNPIKLLMLVKVINGVAAAPFLFVVMRVSSSQRLMGTVDSEIGKRIEDKVRSAITISSEAADDEVTVEDGTTPKATA